ncbi:C-C motif chemokine 27 [Vombatus ursinus]|uniref:Chemokine interleukin-8-like domain-containing protein n=1 Tax=Vombatus ursinus TaxID=29139 RepID=A0A4X2LG02_VOMUR|nr:C-C motif chemokine 27 [Vombatus ursinus]
MKGMELTLTLTLLLLNFSPRKALPLDPSISCCTQVYRKNLPGKVFWNVIQVERQEANGDCHLQAYVLHRKNGRPVCVHPKNRSLARWLSRNKMRQKNYGHTTRLNPTP